MIVHVRTNLVLTVNPASFRLYVLPVIHGAAKVPQLLLLLFVAVCAAMRVQLLGTWQGQPGVTSRGSRALGVAWLRCGWDSGLRCNFHGHTGIIVVTIGNARVISRH